MERKRVLVLGFVLVFLGLVMLAISAFGKQHNPWVAGGGFLIAVVGLVLVWVWMRAEAKALQVSEKGLDDSRFLRSQHDTKED